MGLTISLTLYLLYFIEGNIIVGKIINTVLKIRGNFST